MRAVTACLRLLATHGGVPTDGSPADEVFRWRLRENHHGMTHSLRYINFTRWLRQSAAVLCPSATGGGQEASEAGDRPERKHAWPLQHVSHWSGAKWWQLL
jgi:hypothetical protein